MRFCVTKGVTRSLMVYVKMEDYKINGSYEGGLLVYPKRR